MLKALLSSRQTFAVADQILLSLANLIASYLLLSSAGVAVFGLYSFLMVVCNLISSGFSSTLHGQMTLRIAGKRRTLIMSNFRSTFVLYITLFSVFGLCVGTSLAIYETIPYFESNKRAIVAAVLFAFLLSLFDLFRKYAYVMARQDISARSTVVYFILLLVGLYVLQLKESTALLQIFILLSVCKAIALCVNSLCLGALLSARPMNFSARIVLLKRYWEHGKFSFLGMLTSWVQNQGITPFLMFVAGPLIVGYFSLARLLTVPITVVNTGLINSALPRLRETFNRSGLKAVERKVSTLTTINMGLSCIYFLALLVFHFTGVLNAVFPDYENAVGFLLIWSVVATSILYRSWITQQYAVALKFRFLLMAGLASAMLTYVSIGLLYFTTQNYYMMPVGVWLGETFLIVVLITQKSSVLAKSVVVPQIK